MSYSSPIVFLTFVTAVEAVTMSRKLMVPTQFVLITMIKLFLNENVTYGKKMPKSKKDK